MTCRAAALRAALGIDCITQPIANKRKHEHEQREHNTRKKTCSQLASK